MMFRVFIEQKDHFNFVKALVSTPPNFPFSFNRYTNLEKEKDHIQFRFQHKNLTEAEKHLRFLLNEAGILNSINEPIELTEWQTHANTTQTALTATECGLKFMRINNSYVRPNPMVMLDFMHFFCDVLGFSYMDEYELYTYGKEFWKKFLKTRFNVNVE